VVSGRIPPQRHRHAAGAAAAADQFAAGKSEHAMYEYYERFFEVRLPMSLDDARQRKDALRFLFRAHPSARTKARTFEGNYEWKATITSPTSRVTESHSAYVDVANFAVWVVDTAHGDVLAKTSLAALLKLKPR
jgi:hypothetical protein